MTHHERAAAVLLLVKQAPRTAAEVAAALEVTEDCALLFLRAFATAGIFFRRTRCTGLGGTQPSEFVFTQPENWRTIKCN